MKDTDQEVQTILEKPIKSLQGKYFLSVSNVAKLLSTSTKMIYRMIAEQKLAAVNLAVRKTVISRKEIDRLFEIKEQIKFPEEKLVVKSKIRNSYSMSEAQKKFKISEAGLYQLIKRHKISKFKNGWYTYVAKKDLDIIFNNGIK
jgi:excisionase family DNA binding protein